MKAIYSEPELELTQLSEWDRAEFHGIVSGTRKLAQPIQTFSYVIRETQRVTRLIDELPPFVSPMGRLLVRESILKIVDQMAMIHEYPCELEKFVLRKEVYSIDDRCGCGPTEAFRKATPVAIAPDWDYRSLACYSILPFLEEDDAVLASTSVASELDFVKTRPKLLLRALETYGVVRCFFLHCFRDDVFDSIEQCFPKKYFGVVHF